MKNKPITQEIKEQVKGYLYAIDKPCNTPNLLKYGTDYIDEFCCGDKKLKREWREFVKAEYKRKVEK